VKPTLTIWLILAGFLASPALLATLGGESWLTAIATGLAVPHESCALCGMTRAYLAIGHGDWVAAHVLNAGALPLFGASCANAVVALVTGFVGMARRDRR
jgi:hypothetical protein